MTDQPRRRLSRRRVLAAGLTAGATALAGCNGGDGDGSPTGTNTTSGGTGTPSPGGLPATDASFTNWLYEPGAILDREGYDVTVSDLSTFRANRSSLNDSSQRALDANATTLPLRDTGLALEQLDDKIKTTISLWGAAGVYRGTFESDAVAASLSSNSYTEIAEYDGVSLFELPAGSISGMVGVADGHVVYAIITGGSGAEPRTAVEALVDAGTGSADRYPATSDDLSTVLDRFDGGTYLTTAPVRPVDETDGAAGIITGTVMLATQATIDGDTTSYRYVRVFDDADSVDMDAVTAWTDSNSFSDKEVTDVRQDGRVVEVETTMDTTEYDVRP